MEFQQCDEQYYYTHISFYENIISLFIIYVIGIIIIIFFIKLPVDVMKKSLEQDLFDNKKEDLFVEEKENLFDEKKFLFNEEELFDNEKELLDNEEELLSTEEELIATEEELLLANYNKKQRAIALQEAYKEKLDILLKKKNEINTKLDNFNKCGYNLFFNTNSSGLSESVVNKILLLRMIHGNISISISNEMPSSEEILRTAKKAGIFDSPYDILELLKIRTNAFDNAHPYYDEYKEVLSKI